MNKKTGKVFHDLMKDGWIDRAENPTAWEYYCDDEAGVDEELRILGSEIGFEPVRRGDRLYIVPTQENDLFLKNNVDYKRDIKGTNDFRLPDLYLLNYLAVYLLYLMYKGEGENPRCREYIEIDDFIKLFNNHCKEVVNKSKTLDKEELQKIYSENFIQLADNWLAKAEKKVDDIKAFNSKRGFVEKLILKLKADELIKIENESQIKPTRKLDDLMPYFLRKERVAQIQNFFKSEEENAAN